MTCVTYGHVAEFVMMLSAPIPATRKVLAAVKDDTRDYRLFPTNGVSLAWLNSDTDCGRVSARIAVYMSGWRECVG